METLSRCCRTSRAALGALMTVACSMASMSFLGARANAGRSPPMSPFDPFRHCVVGCAFYACSDDADRVRYANGTCSDPMVRSLLDGQTRTSISEGACKQRRVLPSGRRLGKPDDLHRWAGVHR